MGLIVIHDCRVHVCPLDQSRLCLFLRVRLSPKRTGISRNWSHRCFVAFNLNVLRTSLDVSAKEGSDGMRLFVTVSMKDWY